MIPGPLGRAHQGRLSGVLPVESATVVAAVLPLVFRLLSHHLDQTLSRIGEETGGGKVLPLVLAGWAGMQW